MFNSSKINNSPHTSNTTLYNNVNDTTNGISRSFIQPKITSTPLTNRESIFATPPKHGILPKRYSLSEIATPPRSNNRDFSKLSPTGPLLASTRYNVNVSTYEDTKSPGLAGRIVQYNEEMERERERLRTPTHQAKYGSPGLFPVVHLFKKKLPTLEQKPRRVTIRIAPPEYSRQHTQEYNRKLLEGIVKPSSQMTKESLFSQSSQSNSSTRSVLDALKEISRKRIHANEEYDLNEESGKRLRTMNNGDSNKRLRDDSPLDKSPSPGKPTSKRICMYDEYAASCSSMDFSFKKTEQPTRKSLNISTVTENPKEAKQIKLINAETQTVNNEVAKEADPIMTTDEEEDQVKTPSGDESAKSNGALKIFDDAPLERIRKNRLAALMGSLTGKEPVLLPKPDYASILNSTVNTSDTPEVSSSEILKSTEKPLVSILSSPKKVSPIKSNKHVHFSVPESTSETNISSSSVISVPTVPSSISVAVVPPSSSETKMNFGIVTKATPETPAPPSSPVGLQLGSSASTTALPLVTFDNISGSNSSSATSIVSKESTTSLVNVDATPKTNFVIPNFQFKPPTASPPAQVVMPVSKPNSATTNSSQLTFPSPAIASSNSSTSPPKMGGFKFDLSKPVAAPATVAPTFSFGNTSQSNTTKIGIDSGAVVPTPKVISQNTTTFNFTKPTTSDNNLSIVPSFGIATTTTNALSNTVSAPPTFKFGSGLVNNEIKPASTGFPLAHSTATKFETNTTAPPAFGTNTSTTSQMSNTSSFGTSKPPMFAFGAPKVTSAPTSFGVSVNQTTVSSGFGVALPANTTSSSTFGVPSHATPTPIPFGTSSMPNSFGTGTTTSNSNFLNTSSTAPITGFGGVTTSSTLGGGGGGFGTPNTTTITTNSGFNSNSMFGATKAVSPFGVSNTVAATPAFGTASATAANSSPFNKTIAPPQYGQTTTQPAFGIPPTTTVSFGTANTFGGTTTTASSVFGGSNSVFSTKTASFGSPNTTNIFGGTVNTQPSGFGTTTSKPLFVPATSTPFGASTNTTTAGSFGTSNTPTFNFGAKTTPNPSFGSGNAFGTTTTASTGFGTSAPPAFSSSNSFGSGGGGGASTNFGSSNAFGGSSTPAFGVATTTNQPSGFGVTNTPSFGTANAGFSSGDNKGAMFGNSTAAPTFGSNAPSPFGGPTSAPGFGVPNNNSSFGPNAAVSAFAKPQATQNAFGSPATNAFGTSNSFGTSQPQPPSFGSSNPPNTQNAVFSFGATTTPKPPGVFSFGGASSNEVPKPSFNFTGGSSAPPSFGSGATPSFGSSAPAPFGTAGIPQFNAPQTATQGMFSIGSGTSSGKTRTHLKPKRRT